MKPALLIVGHGTRDAAGVAGFQALVRRVQTRFAGRSEVAGGFIELSRPPLTEAVGALADRGQRQLVTIPLVLVAAGHGKGDIPAAMDREVARRPGLSYHYGRPLGPHPALLTVLAQRVHAALDGVPPETTTVLLVGRGSTDPDANAEVAKVSRLLWEGRGYAGVETAFISLAGPGVPAGLDRARLLGARRVVVLPYFLFAGVLPDRVATQAQDWAAKHPEVEVRVAGVIGDCEPLADLVAERYEEALLGDIRMNCDTCMYRIALPGFEHRVGAPRAPHDHPDDPAPGHHDHSHDHSGDHSPDHSGGHSRDHSRGHSQHHALDHPHDHAHLQAVAEPCAAENGSGRDLDPAQPGQPGPGAEPVDLEFHGDLELVPGAGGASDGLGPVDLEFHGDLELVPRAGGASDGTGPVVDLAVNVAPAGPPPWLRARLAEALDTVGGYPDLTEARTAVALRHTREADQVLLTAGTAEAFVLVARAIAPRHAVVLHPQFTEPEAALRRAGHQVQRVLLPPPFQLHPDLVPDTADLVLVGNPTNPTSVLHPAAVLARLARPGRTLVVDEAFIDAVPGERDSLADRTDLPGLVVLRSLTKTWALPGLRIGYLLAEPATVRALSRQQPLWPVSSLAAAAAAACSRPEALAEAAARARVLGVARSRLIDELRRHTPGVAVVEPAAAPFLLLRVPDGSVVRRRLRAAGWAVRRGETFPGLGPDWLRVAVRDDHTGPDFARALADALPIPEESTR